jgi:hypothetical protein
MRTDAVARAAIGVFVLLFLGVLVWVRSH